MKKSILLFVLLIFFVSCSTNNQTANNNVATPTLLTSSPGVTRRAELLPTQSLTPPMMATPFPTVSMAVPTQSSIPPLKAEMNKNCANIVATFPKNITMEGVIILKDLKGDKGANVSFAWDVATNQKIYFLNSWLADNWLPSSDEKLWLHTFIETKSSQTTVAYEVMATDGHIKNPISVEKGWEIRGWVNSQNLILDKQNDPVFEIYKSRVYDPIQEMVKDLPFDFPDVATPFERLPYNLGIYSPSLDRVVYPTIFTDAQLTTQKGFYLRDVVKKINLAFLSSEFQLEEPKWSPDGQQFAVVAYSDYPAKNSTLEFFSVNWNGQVKQLSALGASAPSANPTQFSWSPDGQWIAFWLADRLTPDAPEELAVLNVTSGDITNYCISGFGVRNSHPPIWSTDSKQLLVQRRDEQGIDSAVLLDRGQGVAINLGVNLQPEFWLRSFPSIWRKEILP